MLQTPSPHAHQYPFAQQPFQTLTFFFAKLSKHGPSSNGEMGAGILFTKLIHLPLNANRRIPREQRYCFSWKTIPNPVGLAARWFDRTFASANFPTQRAHPSLTLALAEAHRRHGRSGITRVFMILHHHPLHPSAHKASLPQAASEYFANGYRFRNFPAPLSSSNRVAPIHAAPGRSNMTPPLAQMQDETVLELAANDELAEWVDVYVQFPLLLLLLLLLLKDALQPI